MLYDLYNVNGLNVGEKRESDNLEQKASPEQMNKANTNIQEGKVNGEPMLDNE